MANKFYEETDIAAIASAIRTKLGVQTTYKVSEMADAVDDIISIPSYLTIERVTVPSDSKTFTVQSDTTRSIGMCMIIPVSLSSQYAYHGIFVLAKSNVVTGAVFEQCAGSYLNHNGTSESFNANNAGTMTLDDTTGIITISTRSDGNYTFYAGDVFDVYIIYTH